MHLHGSPHPRTVEIAYQEWTYPETHYSYLTIPQRVPDRPFLDVIDGRRSRREFGPLSMPTLSAILWYSSKTRASAKPGRPRWEHRPTPSAGGCHPIDIVISNLPAEPVGLFRYNPHAHALTRLRLAQEDEADRLHDLVESILATEQATVLWHAAQFGRTRARYQDADSLVWRDAGAMLATTGLVAEALGASCCSLGATGEPFLSRALGSGDAVVGVGACVVGSRVGDGPPTSGRADRRIRHSMPSGDQ